MSSYDPFTLEPCPHCAGPAALHHDGGAFAGQTYEGKVGNDGYRVECEGECHAMTCWWHSEAEAVAAWNRRTPEPRWVAVETYEELFALLPCAIVQWNSGDEKWDFFCRIKEGDARVSRLAKRGIKLALTTMALPMPLPAAPEAPEDEETPCVPDPDCETCGGSGVLPGEIDCPDCCY